MGGNRLSRGASASRRIGAGLLIVGGLAACGSDDDTNTNVVRSADAITAVVAWQADEQQPVLDDDGEPLLPVIFVVAGDGATIDVGVQAEVAAATTDWAKVRFADDVNDTFDPGLDGEPVRESGAMLLVGPIPDPARSIELDLARYTAVDDVEAFTLQITSEPQADDGDPAPRASVTAVTQP